MKNIELAKQLLKGKFERFSIGNLSPSKRILSAIIAGAFSIGFYNTALSDLPKEEQRSIQIESSTNNVTFDIFKKNKQDIVAKLIAQKNKHSSAMDKKLPFEVTDEDTTGTLIQKSLDNNMSFLALALRLEEPKRVNYYDVCGANIGLGYCTTSQVREKGTKQVIKELTDAGVSLEDAKLLTHPKVLNGTNKKIAKDVVIPMESVVRLTIGISNTYRDIAKNSINTEDTDYFSKLDSNRQDVLTWLAYNTGEGFKNFKRLITAVQKSTEKLSDKEFKANEATILKNLAPWFKEDGKYKKNVRADAYLSLSMFSAKGLSYAVNNPNIVESYAEDKASLLTMMKKSIGLKSDKTKKVETSTINKNTTIDAKAEAALKSKNLISKTSKQELTNKIEAKNKSKIKNNEQYNKKHKL